MRRTTQLCATSIAFAIAGCSSNNEAQEDAPLPIPDAPVPIADAPVPPDAPVDSPPPPRTFVYIESNDPAGNAVLAFERQADGTLAPASTNRFPAGGPGITAGANQRTGPLDSDREVILSSDGTFLYAVNSGDSSIAAFHTSATGDLTPVTGSPFSSLGPNPVSVAIAGATMQVVNKAAAGLTGPSYNSLTVRNGTLTPLAGMVAVPIGASPVVATISANQRLLFGTEFFDQSRVAQTPIGQIDVFVRGPNGALAPAIGSPNPLPPDTSGITPTPLPVALNVIAHPRQNILYVGFPTRNQVGVYTYDASTGALTFVLAAPNSGQGVGWFLINSAATRLYTVNSGSATISTYDVTLPRAPREVDAILLKDAISGKPFVDANGVVQTITSQPFQLAFDPDESHIYVVSQRVTTNPTDPSGDFVHTLTVASDGTLSEPSTPFDLRTVGVPPTARPQGIAVLLVQP
jgi:hypothetical protein